VWNLENLQCLGEGSSFSAVNMATPDHSRLVEYQGFSTCGYMLWPPFFGWLNISLLHIFPSRFSHVSSIWLSSYQTYEKDNICLYVLLAVC
jgi:hypothetical protein